MASSWITKRPTRDDGMRFRVMFRLPGSRIGRYGGSFRTREEAEIRRTWVLEELAAMRVPDLRAFKPIEPERAAPAKTLSFEERGEGKSLLSVVDELRREAV